MFWCQTIKNYENNCFSNAFFYKVQKVPRDLRYVHNSVNVFLMVCRMQAIVGNVPEADDDEEKVGLSES